MNLIEQLTTFTDFKWVTGARALALVYMTYSPSTPKLHSGYGVTDVQWFVLDKDQDNYVITHDQQEITPGSAGHLIFDHIQIIITAIDRIKNKLDY